MSWIKEEYAAQMKMRHAGAKVVTLTREQTEQLDAKICSSFSHASKCAAIKQSNSIRLLREYESKKTIHQ